MATLTIEVTQEDINRGIKGNEYSCALALALYRTIHGSYYNGHEEDHVSVFPVGAWRLGNAICEYYYPLDDVGWKKFINRFDHGEPVEPTTFEVTVMDE